MLAVLGLLSLPCALAEGNDMFSLSGFGTLGVAYHDERGVTYRRDVSQIRGAESGRIDPRPDSMLGAQLNVRLSGRTEAVLQAISREAIGTGWAPRVNWAYLKYTPDESSALRLGRLGLDLDLQGDLADIGYAGLMVRPQVILNPRFFEGVDAETTVPMAGGTLRLKGLAGWTRGRLLSGGEVYDTSGSTVYGGLAEYMRGGWSGRLSAGRVTMAKEAEGVDALREALASAPEGHAALAGILMENRRQDFAALALAYEGGPLRTQASYTRVVSPGWTDQHMFYANAGYRLERLTPYLGYTRFWMDSSLVSTGIPDGLSEATDQFNAVTALAQSAPKVNKHVLAAGLRYELDDHMALKVQADVIRYKDPDNLIDPAQDATPADRRSWKSMMLYSMSLDFVF